MDNCFVVRTPVGFVGRSALRGPLVATQPLAFASCFETEIAADQVAESFPGGEVFPYVIAEIENRAAFQTN